MLRKVKNHDPLKIELYDMETDPSESKNLASKHPDKVKELEKLWLAKQDEFIEDANLGRSEKKKR